MMSKTPYERLRDEREDFKQKKKEYERNIEKIYEENGITEIVNLIDKIKKSLHKSDEISSEIEYYLIPLLCEMTEGPKTKIKNKFLLEDGKLYRNRDNLHNTVITSSFFIRKSGAGPTINPGPSPTNEKQNPFYHIRENIYEKSIKERTGEKLEILLEKIKNNRKEITTVIEDYEMRYDSKINNEQVIGRTICIEGESIETNDVAIVSTTKNMSIVCVPKLISNNSHLKIMFFETPSDMYDDRVYLSKEDFIFGIDENTAKKKKQLLHYPYRIEKTTEILQKTLDYVENLEDKNQEVLDKIKNDFTAEKIAKDL